MLEAQFTGLYPVNCSGGFMDIQWKTDKAVEADRELYDSVVRMTENLLEGYFKDMGMEPDNRNVRVEILPIADSGCISIAEYMGNAVGTVLYYGTDMHVSRYYAKKGAAGEAAHGSV